MQCSAEQRAKQLEVEIWKLIDEGKLQLQKGTYLERLGQDSCCGCALGSAARAVFGLEEASRMGSGCMRRELETRGVGSYTETLQLEMGFEGWCGVGGVRRDVEDPFFQLGARLRRHERPAGGE